MRCAGSSLSSSRSASPDRCWQPLAMLGLLHSSRLVNAVSYEDPAIAQGQPHCCCSRTCASAAHPGRAYADQLADVSAEGHRRSWPASATLPGAVTSTPAGDPWGHITNSPLDPSAARVLDKECQAGIDALIRGPQVAVFATVSQARLQSKHTRLSERCHL